MQFFQMRAVSSLHNGGGKELFIELHKVDLERSGWVHELCQIAMKKESSNFFLALILVSRNDFHLSENHVLCCKLEHQRTERLALR